jgi:hypothetical protein
VFEELLCDLLLGLGGELRHSNTSRSSAIA